MAEHRQNVALTPLSLVEVTREEDGGLTFDYARFDRWVRMFEEAGVIGRIELGHTAHHGEGGWSSDEFILNNVSARDSQNGETVSLPPDEGLAPLLRDLERHLDERGWLDHTMIHIGDEPSLHNINSWRKASAFVHACAPGIPRIEAIESRDYDGVLEMWVPKLNYIPTWGEDYREAQAAGNEIWFYTCLHPRGRYPNRLLDMPLAATRVLHWINWSHRLDGYLHWGWNSWREDPFETLGPDTLPPGDCYIVYPGKDGPLDSIRWETMRDGIEDYEKLRLLSEKTRDAIERLGEAAADLDPEKRADEVCRRIVPAITDFERDPEAFRETLDLLHDEIRTIDSPPLAVVATAPEAETVVVSGPIVLEAFGAVEPGTKVEMYGRAVEVKPDGRFAVRTSPDRNGNVELTIEKDGRKKTIRRHFQVR
jgi:hypothetical protein